MHYAIKNIRCGTLRDGYYFSKFDDSGNAKFGPLTQARLFDSSNESLGVLCKIVNSTDDALLIVVEVEMRETRVVWTPSHV